MPSMTGTTLSTSSSSTTALAPGLHAPAINQPSATPICSDDTMAGMATYRVDSPPTSTTAAPSEAMSMACFTATSTRSLKRPPSLHTDTHHPASAPTVNRQQACQRAVGWES